MLDWARDNAPFLAGLSTIVLALFAGIQIALEVSRRRARRHAADIRALGPAWLARRSLAVSLESGVDENSPFEWARRVGGKGLDPLERHMLDVLRIGSEASRQTSESANTAFEAFLGFADDINRINSMTFTAQDSRGGLIPSETERARAEALAASSIAHLKESLLALGRIAPRQGHEPSLAPDAKLPLLKKR